MRIGGRLIKSWCPTIGMRTNKEYSNKRDREIPRGQAPLTKCEQKFEWRRKVLNLVKRNWLQSLSELDRIQT